MASVGRVGSAYEQGIVVERCEMVTELAGGASVATLSEAGYSSMANMGWCPWPEAVDQRRGPMSTLCPQH